MTRTVVIVREPERQVLIARPEERLPVVMPPQDRTALIVAQRGPKGDPGDADPTYIASVSINAHRVVRVVDGDSHVAYAQPTLSGVQGIAGVSLNAASMNSNVTVRREGEITDPSFMFTADQPIFLTSNGFMTQVVPSSGVIQKIGYAITTTTMALAIDPPIAI